MLNSFCCIFRLDRLAREALNMDLTASPSGLEQHISHAGTPMITCPEFSFDVCGQPGKQ